MSVKKETRTHKDVLASSEATSSSAIVDFEQELEKYSRQLNDAKISVVKERTARQSENAKYSSDLKKLHDEQGSLKVALEEESNAKKKAQRRTGLLKGNYENDIKDLKCDYEKRFRSAARISMERENKIRLDNDKLMSDMKMEHANELSDARAWHTNELCRVKAYNHHNSQYIHRLEQENAALRDELNQAPIKWKMHYEGQIKVSDMNLEVKTIHFTHRKYLIHTVCLSGIA